MAVWHDPDVVVKRELAGRAEGRGNDAAAEELWNQAGSSHPLSEDEAVFVRVHLEEWPAMVQAGVVDQDVERAEPLDHFPRQRGHRGHVGHVEWKRFGGPRGKTRHYFAQRLCSARNDGDLRARRDQLAHHGQPDPR